MSAMFTGTQADMSTTTSFNLTPLKKLLGTMLLGVFFSLILYGVILHQFYRYCRAFPSDAIFIRILIIGLMILETMHTVMTMHYPYVFLVTNYGNPLAFLHEPWSIRALPLVAGFIIIFSQLFFIGRIYMIGLHYRIVAGITGILMLAEIPLAIYVLQAISGEVKVTLAKLKWTLGTGLLIPSIVDTFLTSTLIIVIRRSRAGLKRNDGIIDLLVTYVINTGLLHWALNWGCFASFVVSREAIGSTQYVSINIVAARVYAMTFLCVLNSRETKSSEAVFSTGTYGLKVIERTKPRAAAERWNVPQLPDNEPASINIRVTTEMDNEPDWDGPRKARSETTSSELDCAV